MRKRVVSVALAVALAVAPLGWSAQRPPRRFLQVICRLALRSAASSNDANANDVATVADDAAVNGWTIDRNTAKGGEILAAGTGDYAMDSFQVHLRQRQCHQQQWLSGCRH